MLMHQVRPADSAQGRWCPAAENRKENAFCLNFPHACPKPVWAKWSFLYENGSPPKRGIVYRRYLRHDRHLHLEHIARRDASGDGYVEHL
jgi:hypothetical protein